MAKGTRVGLGHHLLKIKNFVDHSMASEPHEGPRSGKHARGLWGYVDGNAGSEIGLLCDFRGVPRLPLVSVSSFVK